MGWFVSHLKLMFQVSFQFSVLKFQVSLQFNDSPGRWTRILVARVLKARSHLALRWIEQRW